MKPFRLISILNIMPSGNGNYTFEAIMENEEGDQLDLYARTNDTQSLDVYRFENYSEDQKNEAALNLASQALRQNDYDLSAINIIID